jgi:UDP-N-acetylmuramoylalanine--D-glutamate ligase
MNSKAESGFCLVPGQQVLVMGLARSGEAVARLLMQHGVSVTLNEAKPRPENDQSIRLLEDLGAVAVFGGHPLDLLGDVTSSKLAPDYIVKNPGIPYHVPLLREAEARQIPIYTEIEVASWLAKSPIYAITGSNGKTTTTTLVGQILSDAGQQPSVAGNIGTPFSAVVETLSEKSPVVLEVSSFQLLGISKFHPKIAAWLNVYPAHLDYHGSMDAYVEAKFSLFQNMTSADYAVLNYDHEIVRHHAAQMDATVVWFSRTPSKFDNGTYLQGETLMLVKDGIQQPIVEVSQLSLKGSHNLENLLAAAAITAFAGVPVDVIARGLTAFRGVEHRTEFVACVRGVDYYNDSKATNAQAALGALRGFSVPIVWIAGGLDRGVKFEELREDLRTRVKVAILLGESAPILGQVCEEVGVSSVFFVASLEEAVHMASTQAKSGEVVLLSPACASWDMFDSFEQRGSMFKDAVHRL